MTCYLHGTRLRLQLALLSPLKLSIQTLLAPRTFAQLAQLPLQQPTFVYTFKFSPGLPEWLILKWPIDT